MTTRKIEVMLAHGTELENISDMVKQSGGDISNYPSYYAKIEIAKEAMQKAVKGVTFEYVLPIIIRQVVFTRLLASSQLFMISSYSYHRSS